MESIINILLKMFVWLYHFSYQKISVLSIIDNKGVHPKHRITNYHNFFVDNISSKDNILDIGCGDGLNTFYLSKKASHVTGIDILKSKISFAKKHYCAKNITYLFGDATKFKFKLRFDKIVLSNVLEHIKDRKNFLISLHRLSNILLIRVPLLSREWLPVYLKEKGLNYAIDPTHETEFTDESFEKELKGAKWKIINKTIQFGEIWAVVGK